MYLDAIGNRWRAAGSTITPRIRGSRNVARLPLSAQSAVAFPTRDVLRTTTLLRSQLSRGFDSGGHFRDAGVLESDDLPLGPVLRNDHRWACLHVVSLGGHDKPARPNDGHVRSKHENAA